MDISTLIEFASLAGGIATVLAFFIGPTIYLGAKIEAFKDKIDEFKTEFNKESKDFHGRLCALEEKYIQMMQKAIDNKESSSKENDK